MPRSKSLFRLWSSRRLKTCSLIFDRGHTVRGIFREASSSRRRSSWLHVTPWSMRDTPRQWRQSQMFSAGPSSPACETRSKPSSCARLKRRANFSALLPISVESNPTPLILFCYNIERTLFFIIFSFLSCYRDQIKYIEILDMLLDFGLKNC
jgi:hypothetical protein